MNPSFRVQILWGAVFEIFICVPNSFFPLFIFGIFEALDGLKLKECKVHLNISTWK